MHLFIDSDIFVRDLRYPQDPYYNENLFVLDLIKSKQHKAFTSIFNLLEVCGILSYNLSHHSLMQLYAGFRDHYQVQILFINDQHDVVCFNLTEVTVLIGRRMSFGDALIAYIVEHYKGKLDCLISWNAAHFRNKVSIQTFTPLELKDHLRP